MTAERRPPPRGEKARLLEDARARGEKARLDGKPREACPIHSDYPVKGARKAWLEGWDSAAPEPLPFVTRTPESRVTLQARLEGCPAYWPKDLPLPETFRRRPPVPCFRCRLVTMASGSQAVIVRGTDVDNGKAYFECRGCGFQFKMRMDPR